MKIKWLYSTLAFSLFSSIAFSQEGTAGQQANYMGTFVLPILIAVVGYVMKSVYDIVIERQKRKRSLVEDKLKNFYWPILTRLEQNSSIWKLILQKRSEMNALQKKIGEYVEENIILKNHREIMDIIIKYRYLAKFDDDLSKALNDYFRHVAIYEGILHAKENIFPGYIGAPYPNEFDVIIQKRAIDLQLRLDKKSLV